MKRGLTRRFLCALLCAALFLTSAAAADGDAGADNYIELKYGMKDDEGVRQMQRRLIELGYLSSSATGGYWDQTKEAVALYQASVGLPVNGKVATAEMQALLFGTGNGGGSGQTVETVAPVETTPAPATPVYESEIFELHYAMEGSDAVRRMQKRLKELGFFGGGASGGYWSQTKEAVAAFQAKAGLPVDGKTASVEMLNLLYSQAAPSAVSETVDPLKAPVIVDADPTATPAPASTDESGQTGTPAAYTELRAYVENEAVRAMQKRLKELGFFAGNATGGYYNVTITAVELFQRAAGLAVNGKVATVEMQERLFAADAPNAYSLSASYGELSYGMENNDQVRLMQRRLSRLGYYTDVATGNYYSATSRAVAAFQEAIGFEVDGKVATTAMLRILYANNAPAFGTSLEATPEPGEEPTSEPAVEESTAEPVYTELTYGLTNNEAVSALQQRLKALGFLSCDATGNYYSKTADAVCSFLSYACMTGDGNTATVEMQRLLFASDLEAQVQARWAAQNAELEEYAAASTDIILYPNNTGEQILLLTKRLVQLGYLSGEPLETYTSDVTEAVMWFQNSNGLEADGIAGPKTLSLIYTTGAISAAGSMTGSADVAPATTDGTAYHPVIRSIRNIDFFSSAGDKYFNRQTGVFCDGAKAIVTDVETGISYQVKRRGGYNHADVEPVTAFDTWQMYRIYGLQWAWTRRAVIVTLSDGTSLAASINGMPHGNSSISGNNMDGHTCIHFLNSRTHSSDKVDAAHQAAVATAASMSAGTIQARVNAQ
ncbi:MAG: peptidoglycan-binding protein [Clostridia bacterium]|nr:peptidoglycan-binding protein [Clostridia bacterium]